MSIELPKITHQTNDYSDMSTVPSSGLKIALPIEGTTGRMGTMRVDTQKQLLKEYSITSEISPNLSDSILHALKLLQFTPIYTSRVGSTNVLPGYTDKPGIDGSHTVFTDSEYAPYYKSSKFKLSHDKLKSIKFISSSSTIESESKDILEAVSGLSDTYSITDNGKLVSFISPTVYEIEIDGQSISENDDFAMNELTNITKVTIGEDTPSEDSDSGDVDGPTIDDKSEYIYMCGCSFHDSGVSNLQYKGTNVSLRFYDYHGSNDYQAVVNKSGKIPVLSYLVYIVDYLKSNNLSTPIITTYNEFDINLPSEVEVEVIGSELSKYVEVKNGTVKVSKNLYTPSNCGFKITTSNGVHYLGVGDFNRVKKSDYYSLSTKDFTTVEKLAYRLYEVLSNATESSWLGINGASTSIEFNPEYYFNTNDLMDAKVVVSGTSESGNELEFINDNELYSYALGNTKYQLSNLEYDDQYLTIKKVTNSGNVISTKSYVFYNGEYPYDEEPGTEYMRISASPLSYSKFISLLISALKTKFNAVYSDNGFTLFEKDTSISYLIQLPSNIGIFDNADEDSDDEDGIITILPTEVDYTQLINNAALIVVSTGINSENILKFTMTRDTVDPELYHITLIRKNDEESYVISFVEDKVDGYGVVRYYPYVNDEDTGSKYFRLVRINTDINNLPSKSVESRLFGSEVEVCESSETDWQVAINRFRENTGDKYDFLFDAGHANVSVANTLCNLGIDLYSSVGITLPDDKSVDNLINYRQAVGMDNHQLIMRAPRVPDTTLGNFVVYMSPITQYLQRLVLNKSAGKEFAPIFGKTNGSAMLAPKYRYDSDEDRQRLCDNQIAPLIWDRANQMPYFLLDLTGQRKDSNLSDGNNVRMDNLIAHLSDEIAERYIGRFNDEDTRSEFTSDLNIAIQNRLISHQQYRINAYKIVCNETNNPNEVVDARQLVVDIYEQYRPGIRYVKIYQGIYKLSQSI